MTLRVGLGFDVHPFVDDASGERPLVLGGVTIPDTPGLAGFSDADVVVHAVSDALLGAAGLPDLGTLFPAVDSSNRDASSLRFLEEIAARLHEEGWAVVNVDVVIAAEVPRLAPHLDAMRTSLATSLVSATGTSNGLAPVTVKPKHAEGLGAIGRAEGIAAWAVALVERREPARTPSGPPRTSR